KVVVTPVKERAVWIIDPLPRGGDVKNGFCRVGFSTDRGGANSGGCSRQRFVGRFCDRRAWQQDSRKQKQLSSARHMATACPGVPKLANPSSRVDMSRSLLDGEEPAC